MQFTAYSTGLARIFAMGFLALQITSPAHANRPVPENMIFCTNGYRTLTLYESETPRMIEQDIILRHPGTFIVTVTADGFSFQGLSYARRSYGQKWTPIKKTARGQRRWSQSWRIRNFESESHIRLQLIKDSGDCKACTAKLEIKSQCS